MLRWSFKIASSLSLVLCVLGMVYWVHGYFYSDTADWRDSWQVVTRSGRVEYHARQTVLWSTIGEFRFSRQRSVVVGVPMAIVDHGPGAKLFLSSGQAYWTAPSKQSKYLVNRWGFRVGEINQSGSWGSVHDWEIGIPAWGWVLFFGLLPAARGMMAMRRKRAVGNSCSKCGYDLRATKERCPECGMVVESAGKV